ELYGALWRPLEALAEAENIIIIPDRELFNLSFELLAPTGFSSYRDLAQNSLLARHNISYNYSMMMVGKGEKILEFDQNFIAFAPGFNKAMKQGYRLAIKDSIFLDRAYLTLLPQPFNTDVVKKFSRVFD